MIEILKNNMDEDARLRILTYKTKDKNKFFHVANNAYKDALKYKEKKSNMYSQMKPQRRVNELDFEDLSSHEIEEIATKINNLKLKRNNLKCFNCQSEEHLLRKCPLPITRFFCFVCGMEGVAYPKCPNCLNHRRSASSVRENHS